MNLYTNHSDKELVTVLAQCEKLTYEAQLNLAKELNRRNTAVDRTNLTRHINDTEQAISEFAYLKDLGFKYTEDASSGSIEVKRTFFAEVFDIVSAVLGTLFFAIGLVYFWLLMAVFFGDNEFTMGKLVQYGLMILLGLIGFKMLSGINRFLDYRNFRLVRTGDTIQLNPNPKGKELQYALTDITSEVENDELILKVGEIEVIRGSVSNLIQKKTIEALVSKMKTNK